MSGLSATMLRPHYVGRQARAARRRPAPGGRGLTDDSSAPHDRDLWRTAAVAILPARRRLPRRATGRVEGVSAYTDRCSYLYMDVHAGRYMAWSERAIQLVWEKGIRVEGYPETIRKDVCGDWIQRNQHGSHSNYGWEIDHIVPASRGGPDALHNLRPLHWQNNRKRQDGTLNC